MVVKEAEKMADENEDQWLYGESNDGKEYTPTNIQSEVQQNDSLLINIQDKSQTQEDQQVEGTETSSEVRNITYRSSQTSYFINCYNEIFRYLF